MGLKAKNLDAVRPTVPVVEVGWHNLVRVNINVQEATRRTWKRAALDRQITMSQLIEAVVNELFE